MALIDLILFRVGPLVHMCMACIEIMCSIMSFEDVSSHDTLHDVGFEDIFKESHAQQINLLTQLKRFT